MKKTFFILLGLTLLIISLIPAVSFAANDDIFLEVEGRGFIREPATSASFTILVGNLRKSDDNAILKELAVFDGSGKLVKEIRPEKTLEKITAARDKTELKKLIGLEASSEAEARDAKRPEKLEEIKGRVVDEAFTVDLKQINPNLKVGDTFELKIEGTFMTGRQSFKEATAYQISYLSSLPFVSDWYAGDGHVHTKYSGGETHGWWRDVNLTVSEAKDVGFGWLAITDHGPALTQNSWEVDQRNEIKTASQFYSLPVLQGEELGTQDPTPASWLEQILWQGYPWESHYLSYNLSDFISNPDYPEGLGSGQETINIVSDNNWPNSFGIIAHPFDFINPVTQTRNPYYPWFTNWPDATGYSGMEIVTGGETEASGETLAKWDSLLNESIPEALAGRQFPVGVANSDTHFGLWYGQRMTYLYMPYWNGSDLGTVYDAMKKGRAVASSDGSLAVATLSYDGKTYQIGDEVEINQGDAFQIRVEAKGVDSKRVSKIRLISNYADTERYPAHGRSYTRTIDISSGRGSDYVYPSQSGYYRVEVDFAYRGKTYTTYTNPI